MDDVIAVIVCVCAGEAAWEDSAGQAILTTVFFLLRTDLHLIIYVVNLIFIYLQRLMLDRVDSSSAHKRDTAFRPNDMHMFVFMMKNFASMTICLISLGLISWYFEALNLQQWSSTARISALIFVWCLVGRVIILDNLV